jgi:hypothetical protein
MGNCTACNSVINSNRRGKKYCSNACKQQSYYVRRKGGVLPTFDSVTYSGFSFEQFQKIKVALGKDNEVSFLEYSFIRSCAPQVIKDEEIVELVKEITYQVYDSTPKSETFYLEGLENYKRDFFRKK